VSAAASNFVAVFQTAHRELELSSVIIQVAVAVAVTVMEEFSWDTVEVLYSSYSINY